ncbi:MAG: ATP-dependent DNA helicase RecG [Gemmatimonadota bacterium]|nr:ATP-dependent DNA helicase RecG [Gemmatimonadota bacterium]
MARTSLLYGPVQYLKGVGPRRAERFVRMGVDTGRDLLYHIPHRYEDATTVDSIASLSPGDDATVIGTVVSKGVLPTRRRLRVFRAVLKDETGLIECAWPGQPWLDRTIARGDRLLVSGPVRFFHGRQIQPREHTVLSRGADEGPEEPPASVEGQVFPVYPATEGLTHRQVRGIIEENLEALVAELEGRDPLPAAWLEELSLLPLAEALRTLHRPDSVAAAEPARRRLAFEELFFLQLLHARARARLRLEVEGISFSGPPDLTERFVDELPFRLTNAQQRVWREIRDDMERSHPMNRLLQGDVGSGKTVVAALAMLRAVESGYQAVLMAPTELLAEQHLRTLTTLLEPIDRVPVLLTGSVTGKARQYALQRIESGEAEIVVGTHALIQESVAFRCLGMAIVDEQHRFGVEQRRRLREMGGRADALVMSATPIPRSLALVLYGDLDLSLIDELPPGRRPVTTGVRGPESREAAFEFLREQLGEGRQAYIVYPIIEESEVLEVRAASSMHEQLVKRFSEFEVGLLHGRLKAAEKDDVMRRFLAGEIHLLVATTVIEVGIDVPNATVMFIEDAERFGLAQLHQLRGRVGRGAAQSYCVAFQSGREPSRRLAAFAATHDGFALAEEDLRIRGQGDLFGKDQSGVATLRFADLERDRDLLEEARRRARAIVDDDPELAHRAHADLARELEERYAGREAMYQVG